MRRHHGFLHRLRIPRPIRKFHPSMGLKLGALGALTLPFGGGALALRGLGSAARFGGGLARFAGRGVGAFGRRAIGMRGSAMQVGRDLEAQVAAVADQMGVDADELMAAYLDSGAADDTDEGDIYDWAGDPRQQRIHRGTHGSHRAVHRSNIRTSSRRQPTGPLGGPDTLSKLQSLAGMIPGGEGAGASAALGMAGQPHRGRGGHGALMLLPGHRRRCRVRFDANGAPYCAPKRMNVTNVHALNRSMRRVIGFEKLATKATAHLRSMVSKSHIGSARPRRSGHKSSCGCVTCRQKR